MNQGTLELHISVPCRTEVHTYLEYIREDTGATSDDLAEFLVTGRGGVKHALHQHVLVPGVGGCCDEMGESAFACQHLHLSLWTLARTLQ